MIVRAVAVAVAAAAVAALAAAAPASAAPVTWPTGRYAVPDQMPYGTYVAGNKPGAYPGCIWSTWTHDGILIDAYNDTLASASMAEIYSPAIATFTSSAGCTDWVKIN